MELELERAAIAGRALDRLDRLSAAQTQDDLAGLVETLLTQRERLEHALEASQAANQTLESRVRVQDALERSGGAARRSHAEARLLRELAADPAVLRDSAPPPGWVPTPEPAAPSARRLQEELRAVRNDNERLQRANTALRTDQRAELDELRARLESQEKATLNAVRRVRWLLEQRQAQDEELAKRAAYIQRLERAVLQSPVGRKVQQESKRRDSRTVSVQVSLGVDALQGTRPRVRVSRRARSVSPHRARRPASPALAPAPAAATSGAAPPAVAQMTRLVSMTDVPFEKTRLYAETLAPRSPTPATNASRFASQMEQQIQVILENLD